MHALLIRKILQIREK